MSPRARSGAPEKPRAAERTRSKVRNVYQRLTKSGGICFQALTLLPEPRQSPRRGTGHSQDASVRSSRQLASRSRGEQTRCARHFARESATFSRLAEKRKSSPRGTSSAVELAIE